MIGRREFIWLLGGAAAGWPLAARAQQSATRFVAELRSGLSEEGFVGNEGMRELHNRPLGSAGVSCSPAPLLASTCGASCAPDA